jgi:hypothetical protein
MFQFSDTAGRAWCLSLCGVVAEQKSPPLLLTQKFFLIDGVLDFFLFCVVNFLLFLLERLFTRPTQAFRKTGEK